jgi:hypothetical protein
MELSDLVRSLLDGNALGARQWVADAGRTRLSWTSLPMPQDLDAVGLAVAAGIVELLAGRAGQEPPIWTKDIGPAPEPVLLVRAAAVLPRLRRMCEEDGPEPLRRRRILAPPEFLTAA